MVEKAIPENPEDATRAAREALEASERRYRALIERSGDVKMLLALDGTVEYVSPGIEGILGDAPDDRIGASVFELIHEDDVAVAATALDRAGSNAGPVHGELRVRDREGSVRWLAYTAYNGFDDPAIDAIVVNYFDVTERKRVEQRLRELVAFQETLISLVEASLEDGLTEAFYGRVLRSAVDVIPGAQAGSLLLRDERGRCHFAAVEGFDFATLESTFLHESELRRDDRRPGPQIVRGFDRGGIADDDRRSQIYAGGRVDEIAATLSVPVELDGAPVAYFHLDNFDAPDAFSEDAVQMARAFSNQIATLLQRFRLEADLRQERAALDALAHTDALTGLANRNMFYRRARSALSGADVAGPIAVLFFDLDAFKRVNDTLGHQVGDQLLEAVAGRLMSAVRDGDTVSRWGGDEFVLLLPAVGSRRNAEALAQRIIDRINLPFALGDQVIQVGCSIGLALSEDGSVGIDELTREADIALYQAKEAGKNRWCAYRLETSYARGTWTEEIP